MRDLGHIKDIRDELKIMAVLLHKQKGVMDEMERLIVDATRGRKVHSDGGTQQYVTKEGVAKYISEVERLDEFAARAAEAVTSTFVLPIIIHFDFSLKCS